MCREVFVVHSWQNGTRCRDGVNVSWCRSHLFWLVFELGFHPYMRLFSFGKIFCDSFLLLFFYCFLEVVREKRGRQGEDAWSVEYGTWNCVVNKEQRIIINSNASKWNCKFFYTRFRSPSKASLNPSAKHVSFMRLCTQT